MFLFMLMGSVDIFMLSAVSDDAVSAVGGANQLISIAILILEIIGNGAAIVIAQYLGARRLAEASRISALSITLNLAVGLIMSAAFLVFGGSLLRTIHLEGDILAYANTYLGVVGGAIFLQALINIVAAIIRTYGYTRQTMLVSLGMNIFHVVFNYLLIFGHLGFPELGVQGAAISTVASRAISLLVFFWLLYKVMEVKVGLRDYIRWSREYVGKILKIGIPSAVEQITYQACQLVFFYYATFLGTTVLASRQYAMNISAYVYLFSMATGIGTAILVGRYVGARRKEAAYRQVWSSVRWAVAVTVAVDLVVIALREPLLRIFTDNPEIIRIGSQVIVLSLLLETGRTFNLVIINSLRAAGDAKFPVYMGLLSMVCMSLPLGYVLVFELNLGLAGIWLAIAADEWLRAMIMFFRWRSRTWEKHALVGEPQEQAPAPSPAV
ncbi:MATE family efflux transporter [Paenibacillus sp. J31TS4]|nr:MATE family efflux transporter [Paenibacillus sp. J31TS4]